jgi:hypothetical protein
MKVLSRGTLTVRQERRSATETPIETVVPWAKLAEKGTHQQRLRLTAPSIHFPRPQAFETTRSGHLQKARWTARISRFLNRKLPGGGVGDNRIPVLAGDFNARRCVSGTMDYGTKTCDHTLFWRKVKKLNYREALLVGDYNEKLIDFIFTRANVSRVWLADVYKPESDRFYYSDHGTMAALLEDEDETPPVPPFDIGVLHDSEGLMPLWIIQERVGWDGGTGFSKWLIYRRPAGEPWTLAGTTKGYKFIDSNFDEQPHEWVEYKVGGIDRSGNIRFAPKTKWVPN